MTIIKILLFITMPIWALPIGTIYIFYQFYKTFSEDLDSIFKRDYEETRGYKGLRQAENTPIMPDVVPAKDDFKKEVGK